jgi:outer membrane protein OmpA-like peptidoglycan-associated protein
LLRPSTGDAKQEAGPPPEPIHFRAGHPAASESLEDSLAGPMEHELDSLRSNLRWLAAYPQVPLEIVGMTDSRECSGSACATLSNRRAMLVLDWYRMHGANVSQIRRVEGIGNARPRTLERNDDERQQDRVVDTFVTNH